jgi:hypothetical protein
MFRDNIIWVDFRLSKDIREKQILSYADRTKARLARTRDHLQASQSALGLIKLWLKGEQRNRERFGHAPISK